MNKPIVDKKEILKYHRLFKTKMADFSSELIDVSIGFQGKDSYEYDTVHYSDVLNIWWVFGEAYTANRYWNAFGIGKPKAESNVSITCEINYPYEGLNLRIAGLLVKDENNSIILTHSGKIGGGKKNVGKSLFHNNYTGEYIDVGIRNEVKQYALIAAFNSSRFAYQVANFVSEIERIKNYDQTIKGISQIRGVKDTFNEEFSGKKKINKSESEHKCDHGLVVNSLKSILANKKYTLANDVNRDLYILESKNRIKIVFEFKTDLMSQSIYKAVGQLLLNNIVLPNDPKKVLVVPVGINNKIKSALEKLGIKVLEFSWENGTPKFIDLLSIL